MKRILAIIICTVLAAATVSGCSDSSSSKVTNSQLPTADSASSVNDEATVTDNDFLQGLSPSSGPELFGLTREEVSQKTGGAFDKKNAVESENSYDYYSLGVRSDLLGGKVQLGAELPVYVKLAYKKDKLYYVNYILDPDETTTGIDEVAVADAISAYLAANVPEGYTSQELNPTKPKGAAMYFNNKTDGYIIEISLSKIGRTQFPIQVSIESYVDTYGL